MDRCTGAGPGARRAGTAAPHADFEGRAPLLRNRARPLPRRQRAGPCPVSGLSTRRAPDPTAEFSRGHLPASVRRFL